MLPARATALDICWSQALHERAPLRGALESQASADHGRQGTSTYTACAAKYVHACSPLDAHSDQALSGRY